MGDPREPDDLGSAGTRLWASVVADFSLDEHELLLLEQAARTADLCVRLAAAVGAELVDDKGRIRAEIVELRAERIVLARLLAALRVPLGDQERDDGSEGHGPKRLQRRSGARGVYALRAAGEGA